MTKEKKFNTKMLIDHGLFRNTKKKYSHTKNLKKNKKCVDKNVENVVL